MPHPTTLKSYGARAAAHPNATARRLLETMERKKTNLCVSVDVTKSADVLEVVRRVAPAVCMVKVRTVPTRPIDTRPTSTSSRTSRPRSPPSSPAWPTSTTLSSSRTASLPTSATPCRCSTRRACTASPSGAT